MALGSQVGWKTEDGAADDAWNDNTTTPRLPPLSTAVILQKQSYSKVVKSHNHLVNNSNKTLNPSQPDPDRCHFLELPPALILEIFSHLDARALCLLSCTCVPFRRLASDSHGWKHFYCERWGLPVTPSAVSPSNSWRELYMAREERCKVLMGRFQIDMLHGHTAAVRCIRLLPAANLIVTAGYDQVVRVWNLEEGLPLVSSRPLGETLRAIAVDMELLAVAGSDAVIRLWRAIPECPQLFDVAGIWGGAETCLYGHNGPITCLGLDAVNIYSGSWDMSIRVWDRTTLRSVAQFLHNDWVWALVPRGRRILSTAGSHVYSWDVETGHHRMHAVAHVGQAYAVQGSHSGQFVFTGGEDGAVRMFDDRRRRGGCSSKLGTVQDAIAVWMPQRGAVHSLAFEDPWLVAAAADGSVAMMDVRQIMEKASGSGKRLPSARARTAAASSGQVVGKTGEEIVQRFLPGTHHCSFSVDLGADRVVSGGDEKTVRIWDFSQAIEIERSIQASRRSSQRRRRKQVMAQQVPAAVEQKPAGPEVARIQRPEVVASTSTKAVVRNSGWVTLGRIRKSQTVGGP